MPQGPKVVVVGGGVAGLAAAVALGSAGYRVSVLEARAFLGGRATSYPLNDSDGRGETIDNCQHILLRCCTNLQDFYRRLGVADKIDFAREFTWIEPGGQRSVMKRGLLPAPLHFTESLIRLKFLSFADKLAIAGGFLAIRYEYGKRADLESITMLDWLHEKKQTQRAIDRFWRQVLVSAINEELDHMAASHGLQVFALGFLSTATAYEMGVPSVPLATLYAAATSGQIADVKVVERCSVQRIQTAEEIITGLETSTGVTTADAYVLAVPFERVAAIAPELGLDLAAFTHSPITGIHLWFDRAITDLPHATLLDRNIHWLYNKSEGKHVQLVASASRNLTQMPRADVIALALRELGEFFPRVHEAKLEHAHVVKEVRATFSAGPNLEHRRPTSKTSIPNLFLAGDWTRSGWPSTMEGAVRSGYLAAEAVTGALGIPQRFVLPDVA